MSVPKCRECRDGEKDVPADVRVKGVRILDSGRKVPYRGPLCDMHADCIQDDDTELTEITPIRKVEGKS